MNKSLVAFGVTLALLLGTTVLNGVTARRVPQPLASPLHEIDGTIADWHAATDHVLPDPTLRALAPTAYLVRTYRKDNVPLDLFIAFYAQQRAGESMHSPKHCLPGSGWEIWKHDSAVVPVHGSEVQINKFSIQNGPARMLMFYWYQSKTRIVASEYLGKLLLARDTVFSGNTSGSIVRIMLPDTPNSHMQGISFAASLIPEVERCFGSRVLLNR
jgi:EpsI family protein